MGCIRCGPVVARGRGRRRDGAAISYYPSFAREATLRERGAIYVDIVSFFVYCIIVTFTPGPTNVAILSISTNLGIRKSFRYIAGAASALLTLLVASVLCNSALAAVVPSIVAAMQVVGSIYMLWLAYQVFRMRVTSGAPAQAATWVSGCTMQFVNPKIWLLTMTVIPSYVMPHYQATTTLLGFALLITSIALVAFATWALFGTMVLRFLQGYRRTVNTVLALLLVCSAIEVSGIIGAVRRLM